MIYPKCEIPSEARGGASTVTLASTVTRSFPLLSATAVTFAHCDVCPSFQKYK